MTIGARYEGGFQLIRELARGTRSHVYLGSDGRSMEAVKVHPPENAGRADREYLLGCDLDHPHLVRVTRRLEIDGAPAVTMPFVPGDRLGVWARNASMETRLDALDGILAGLGTVHERGFVHRDVKPENVIVGPHDRPVLLDYDLAARIGDRVDAVTTAGTAAYLSPEQMRGEPAEPASDLFAVGVILYRWLTGETPTLSVGPGTDAQHAHRHPAPSAHDASLEAFDALTARLLDPSPRSRPADAAEVRAALSAARAGG